MEKQENKKIWKVRTVKSYPEAHNHLLVGQVLEYGDRYVRLNCKTYHFSRSVNSPKDIRTGQKAVRILPWNRIELINELPSSFDYAKANLSSDEDGKVILSDGKFKCVIASPYGNRY